MSFSIAPKDGASAPAASASQTSLDARARAIARLTGQATPATQAQTSVPAEETAAVSPVSTTSVDQPGSTEGTADASATSTQTAEAAAPEVTKPKEEPLSAQYAQLARKEKALRAEAIKLKAEREAMRVEKEAAAKTSAAPQVDPSQYIPKERLTKDTLAVLTEMGIGYDQLTQMALNGPSPEQLQLQQTISELRNEIKALKDDQTSTKTSIEEHQRQGYQQALKQIKTDASRLVASDPDAYEAIRTAGAVEDVVDLIERTFKEKGELMTVEEAAQAVEEHLAEEAMKYAQLKKIQARLKPTTPSPATAQPGTAQTKQPPKTLTNAVSVAKPMTSKERAIMAAKHGPGWREKI